MSILSAEYDVEIAKRYYIEEAVEEKMIETARKMLDEGYPIDAISRITGISEPEILHLK